MNGKTITNSFTLRHLLGVGGMAEVWYAENEIGMKAAVKIMSDILAHNPEMQERFFNEAKVMAQLDHPNIRKVYGYGEIDGRQAIIMEYLEGNDLKAMMKQGRKFTNDELVKWWDQLVSALNHTHAQQIVHRDIKPSNIFIDKNGDVKLLDFGIAKEVDSTLGTKTGSTLGTMIYMSPEQVKDPKHIGSKSDVYSLAVSFVHLLTGNPPYNSNTSSEFDIMQRIVSNPLDLSSVPYQWQIILKPYLEKNPDKRAALKGVVLQEEKEDSSRRNMENNVMTLDVVNIQQSGSEETMVDNGMGYAFQANAGSATDLKFTVNGIDFVMKYVEGGESFSDYYMGETVVTQALWKAVMGSNPSKWRGDDLPVESVSWNDIQVFLRVLNLKTGKFFRLPVEEEWEYAACGGNKGCGCKFAGSNNINSVAWYEGNSEGKTHPVKSWHSNEIGLFGMSGNVWEWCSSCVLRGGSWYNNADNCSVLSQISSTPDDKFSTYGFRLCLSK